MVVDAVEMRKSQGAKHWSTTARLAGKGKHRSPGSGGSTNRRGGGANVKDNRAVSTTTDAITSGAISFTVGDSGERLSVLEAIAEEEADYGEYADYKYEEVPNSCKATEGEQHSVWLDVDEHGVAVAVARSLGESYTLHASADLENGFDMVNRMIEQDELASASRVKTLSDYVAIKPSLARNSKGNNKLSQKARKRLWAQMTVEERQVAQAYTVPRTCAAAASSSGSGALRKTTSLHGSHTHSNGMDKAQDQE